VSASPVFFCLFFGHTSSRQTTFCLTSAPFVPPFLIITREDNELPSEPAGSDSGF
jgi:hypothetical protein